jgi:tetratricopeptide (TPR) repeat protein
LRPVCFVWAALVIGFVSYSAEGCRRVEHRAVERVAILPFENLTGDPAWNWIAPAAQLILRTETSASLHVQPFRAVTINEAVQAGATRFVQGYATLDGGRLRLHSVEQDAGSHKNVADFDSAGDPAAGVLPLADSIAKRVGDRTRPFGTQNAASIRAWGEALVATDPAARTASFNRAIELDPDFGEAYLSLAETAIFTGDRPGAIATVERARSRQNLFSDYDRARMDLLSAEMSGNIEERRRALVALSRLTTTDSKVLAQLGEMDYAARRFDVSVDELRAALALEPNNANLLNMLGYSYALLGNLDGARDAFERYQRAAPDDPNPLDSMGEAYFFLGHFQEAEQSFLAAHDKMLAKTGAELLKAAQARLFTGDVSGADVIFRRYADLRQSLHDPLLEVESARWRYIEGKHKEAISALGSFAATGVPDYAAYANAQLAIWYLVAGQPGPAQDRAAAAMQSAQMPPVRAAAAVSRFLTQPRPDASQWMIAAEQVFGPGNSPLKTTAIAYGLLLSRQFAPASEVFRSMYQQTQPALDGQIRTLYAWTLIETSRKADAVPLVATYPMPFGAGEALFSTLTFPRFFYVRSAAMQAQGNDAEAAKALDTFRKFPGDLPSIFAAPK